MGSNFVDKRKTHFTSFGHHCAALDHGGKSKGKYWDELAKTVSCRLCLSWKYYFFFFCHQGNRSRNDKCFQFVNIFHGYFWSSGEKQSVDMSQFKIVQFTFQTEGRNVVRGLKA